MSGSDANQSGAAAPATQAGQGQHDDLVSRVGQLTRRLHEILRELGYGEEIERAAQALPDARERLSYVASVTEQAATRSLSAVEIARPLQERLGADAQVLALAWEAFFSAHLDREGIWQLAEKTTRFLESAQQVAAVTAAQLIEVLMAQEFQDLTGQVVRKLTHAVHEIEGQLLTLLLDQAPTHTRQAVRDSGLLDGPAIGGDGRTDVVTSQQQVDDLLESLGF
jgi:chemotaxis protein CheZ